MPCARSLDPVFMELSGVEKEHNSACDAFQSQPISLLVGDKGLSHVSAKPDVNVSRELHSIASAKRPLLAQSSDTPNNLESDLVILLVVSTKYRHRESVTTALTSLVTSPVSDRGLDTSCSDRHRTLRDRTDVMH